MLTGSISAEQHDVFEKEANCFARNLLAPILLLENLIPDKKTSKSNIETVSCYFAISKQAAKAHLDFYDFDKMRLKEYHGEDWDSFTYTNWKVCRKCSHISVAGDFCEICGQNLSKSTGSIHPNALIKTPIHIYNALSEASCDNCGAKLNLSHERVCTECGHDMSNHCINALRTHDSPVYIESLSARFCPHCGGESSYKANGFLQPYNKEAPQTIDRTSFVKGRKAYLREDFTPHHAHKLRIEARRG